LAHTRWFKKQAEGTGGRGREGVIHIDTFRSVWFSGNNPVRARLIGGEERLESYLLSSYPEYLNKVRNRPEWLRIDRLFGEHGVTSDSAQGISVEQFIASANGEKLTVWVSLDYLQHEASLGRIEGLERYLAAVPNPEPAESDRMHSPGQLDK